MKILTNGIKAGLWIQVIVIVIMLVCIALCTPVPDLLMWIFYCGMIITIISGFVERTRRNHAK